MDPRPNPYREGKPLTEIIPPDYRRAKTAAVVLASMVAGAAIWASGEVAVRLACVELTELTLTSTMHVHDDGLARIAPAVLRGPDQVVVMPPAIRSIVHVWVQGCEDCMPAFFAMRDLDSAATFGDVPVYNVAYGAVDLPWAERYGVRTNLVIDQRGANIIRPLGIETFTTLVIDADGTVLHRDRPDSPGYRDRMLAALGPQHAIAPRHIAMPMSDGRVY